MSYLEHIFPSNIYNLTIVSFYFQSEFVPSEQQQNTDRIVIVNIKAQENSIGDIARYLMLTISSSFVYCTILELLA